MFGPARRFRVVAALGLVLALAHGRAWGQEPIWTKAAKLVGCIWQVPGALPTLPAHEAKSILGMEWEPPQPDPSPPGIFSWEKADDAEWHLGMAEFYERLGEPRAAYFHYKLLSRRFPERKEFAEAVQRQRPLLWQTMPVLDLDEIIAPPSWNDGDSPILNPAEEPSGKLAALEATVFPPSPNPGGAAPITDDPLGLIAEVLIPRPVRLLFGVGVQSDAGLSAREEPPSWLTPRRTQSASTAFVMPNRKDILPDSECSRTLIELGVIADADHLLRYSCFRVNGFGFIDSD